MSSNHFELEYTNWSNSLVAKGDAVRPNGAGPRAVAQSSRDLLAEFYSQVQALLATDQTDGTGASIETLNVGRSAMARGCRFRVEACLFQSQF